MTQPRYLIPFIVVSTGCSPELIIPSSSDAAIVDGSWHPPDLTGVDCAMEITALIQCTDVDTKIPYETGHLGCKFRHDRCADFEGDNFLWDRTKTAGSGREPKIANKRFDYWRKAKMVGALDVLGEVKTDDIEISLPQFIVDSTANKLMPEILNEYALARHCGYNFELLVSDNRLYRRLVERLPKEPDFTVREVQGCRP
jgi:hypothetical protein